MGLRPSPCLRSETEPEVAVRVAGAADRLRDQVSMRPHPLDAVINRAHMDRARSRLGSTAFDQAWAEGRNAPLGPVMAVLATAENLGWPASNPTGGERQAEIDVSEALPAVIRARAFTGRVLATVLFTDIVGSTEHAVRLGDSRWKELLDAHDRSVGDLVGRFGAGW